MTLALIDPISPPALVTDDLVAHFLPILIEDPEATIGVHERKGTAIVRLLTEHPASDGHDLLARTVSTDELIRRGPERTGPIVLIDDLLRTGAGIIAVVEQLLAAGVEASRITVAVLGSHEDFQESGIRELGVDLRIWWRELSRSAYTRYRTSLVATFRAGRHHYLDTEHVVVGITFPSEARSRTPSASRLAVALSRSGEVGLLPPDQEGWRISSYYEVSDPMRHVVPEQWGTEPRGTVRKVRVLDRGPGHFALLPICLPDVPSGLERPELDLASLVERCTDGAHGAATLRALFTTPAADDRQRFLRVGLVASLMTLWWALRDLAQEFDGHRAPQLNPSVSTADLRHLAVAHPGLDVEVLDQLTRAVVGNAIKRGRSPSRSPNVPPRPDHSVVVAADAMHDAVYRLLDQIAREVEDQYVLRSAGRRSAVGVEHRRLLAFGRKLGLSTAITSALLDHIIDRAMFSTRVVTVGGRTVRLYEPDGEVTTRALRHERRMGTGRVR